jgi:hypothetical protein
VKLWREMPGHVNRSNQPDQATSKQPTPNPKHSMPPMNKAFQNVFADVVYLFVSFSLLHNYVHRICFSKSTITISIGKHKCLRNYSLWQMIHIIMTYHLWYLLNILFVSMHSHQTTALLRPWPGRSNRGLLFFSWCKNTRIFFCSMKNTSSY